MPSSRPSEKRTLAADAWRWLFEVFMSTRWQRDQVLARFRLTPNDSKALWMLDPKVGKPMRALADAWGTDASNATWVVDRLERRGLAERRTLAGDRRVKLVVLTPRGARMREQILQAFYEPPPDLLALDREDLRSLRVILGKVAAKAGAKHPSALEGSPFAEVRSVPRARKTPATR